MSDVLVTIWCITYNHEKFIRDALEGFVRQETDFRYEVLIHDDASTDKTQAIIKEYQEKYPDIIIPIFEKENMHSKGIKLFDTIGIPHVKGKYVALCEGDDFWLDKHKLQKQVDFLESHPDYSMCCHAGYYVDEQGYKLPGEFRVFDSNCTVNTEDAIKMWICPTASIVYNFRDYLDNRFPQLKNAPCGDYPKIINFSLYGKIYYFSELWSAYRISDSSVSAQWRKNKQVFIDKNKRFISMLDQIDEITKYKYKQAIDYMRARREYEIHCLTGDLIALRAERYTPFKNESKVRHYYYVLLKFCPALEFIKNARSNRKKKKRTEKISYF